VSVAFYCVTDARYFPGAVAMLNSLRLHGHSEPLFVCDCGLTTNQRARLESEARLVDAQGSAAPWLQKVHAPLAQPADVMVLIDVDMIVTRPLTELIEAARGGRVVAFRNDRDVYFPQWGELLDLGPQRPGPYVSSGLVALGSHPGLDLLGLWGDRQGRVELEPSYFGSNHPGYPFPFLDQDVLNAILRTRIAPGDLIALEHRLAANPPFDGLRVTDLEAARAAYRDGVEPYVLHHFDRKPWRARLRANVYSRLLTRLTLGDGLAVRLEPSELPLRLRTGAAAGADRLATDVAMAPAGAVRRLRERRRGSAIAAAHR
jgi:hypothetical protein